MKLTTEEEEQKLIEVENDIQKIIDGKIRNKEDFEKSKALWNEALRNHYKRGITYGKKE